MPADRRSPRVRVGEQTKRVLEHLLIALILAVELSQVYRLRVQLFAKLEHLLDRLLVAAAQLLLIAFVRRALGGAAVVASVLLLCLLRYRISSVDF